MKLPRDISGQELASLLARHGYRITRQTGSHLRLTPFLKGREHHITIPVKKELRVGTLSATLAEVASYLEIDRRDLVDRLFRR